MWILQGNKTAGACDDIGGHLVSKFPVSEHRALLHHHI